ncbi:tetratricopeptide repeat protein [Legionella sp. CNM-4043-24]|uniref:tetratricopeptide repeat protein n=1 Tax=Legionella sp. CNM-4043-24 TaxID=3421646 RepID=UPI00403ACC03
MIKFRYPNITAGYLGIKHSQLTLNSTFYAELFGGNSDIDRQIILPQRVPKKELFDELLLLEENTAAELLITHRNMLVESMHNAFNLLNENKSKQRFFLNWLNILLRYGLFSEIYALDTNHIQSLMNPSDFIEFELIRLNAYFRIAESDETLNGYLNNLANAVLSGTNLSKRVQVLVLNYVIVAAYRFRFKLSYEECLKICCEKLIDLLKNDLENDFGTLIRKSVAYRGLAMVEEFDTNLRSQFLDQAEFVARNINVSNSCDELIAKENLYTCLQSQFKWNRQFNHFEAAKSNLTEIIKLDPYDSTGYGELGFFFLEQNCINEASVNFARAAELGPPAVGMHTYYYAKSLQLLGNNEAAVSSLYEVTKIDKDAVSPWLDLIEYYLEIKAIDKAKEIITSILKNPTYRSQLEADEISQFEAQLDKL